jgi:2-polyprenyl-3-methyl-5-hydroxy-6-metoxy-1,4-benzoquinol methylase
VPRPVDERDVTEDPVVRSTPEWREQWELFEDNEQFLFEEWIQPATIEEMRGKDVLEAGCGGGQHTALMAKIARSVTAVDLNTADIARRRNRASTNVNFLEGDIATLDLGRVFDIVVCIGVIHHTDDPDRTFANLYRHLRPGGLLIIWTYSSEGNELVRWVVEPVRRAVLRHLPRPTLVRLSQAITALLYVPVCSAYRLRVMAFLPYFEYFQNFRRLSFGRNVLNVFDKLNAPQTRFTTRAKCDQWFSPERFESGSVSVRPYKGVSYSLNGVKKK